MRTSQLHRQRNAATEGLRHSCLRQRPPRNTKARHSAKNDTLQGIACDDQLTNTEIANLRRWLQTHQALRGNYPFDEFSAGNVRPRMWHSRPGCVFAPTSAPEPARQARHPADLSLDTHPVYDLIDMATRQLHGVLHGTFGQGKGN